MNSAKLTAPISKGILVQVEKTILLENIQDVAFIEGPILKHFQLSTLKFETAGQSQAQAHDMQLRVTQYNFTK